jgi:hypothetical protein
MGSRVFDRGLRPAQPRAAHSVEARPDRRSILKILAVNGIAIPSLAYLGAVPALAQEAPASFSGDALAKTVAPGDGSVLPTPPSQEGRPGALTRDFADPLLELTRLLRKAAEMEHALLVQYIYAAFSLKPGYESIGASGSSDEANLLAIAIDKMMHLGAVNRLLVALGAAPHLSPPRFPVAPGVYPFEAGLEPLSRQSLARHLYCEAPLGYFDGTDTRPPERELAVAIRGMVGAPANHPSSLYAAIAATAEEAGRSGVPELPSMASWIVAMRRIADRVDEDRLQFLKDLFLGSHPIFAGQGDVWSLPAEDPRYPAYPLPSNPTAYARDASQIANPTTHALARLGNLQYWTALLLLDLQFQQRGRGYRELAVAHMMGPVRSLGRHLPSLGAGMPFDPLEISISSDADAKHRLRFVTALLQEGQGAAEAIESSLPPGYPLSINRDTLTELRKIATSKLRG